MEEMFAFMREKGMLVEKGWFIPDLANSHNEPVKVGDRFYCEPRNRDLNPADIPPDHPFRAVLGLLHAAEKKLVAGDKKTIRLYVFSLY